MVIRLQWELLLYIFVLNLVVGLVIVLGVPGTEYVNPVGDPVDASAVEGHFNATKIATGWSATPFSGIPLVGDIFAGFTFLVQDLGYLIDGFPSLLTHISNTYIVDVDGQFAFSVIANVLRAIYALLISMFLIEFISGRVFSD